MLICRADNEFLVSIDYEQKEDLLKEDTIIIPKQIKKFNLTSRYENITKIVFEKGSNFAFSFPEFNDIFYWFPNLENVEINNSDQISEDGIVYSENKKTLIFVPFKHKNKNLSIKEGVKFIGIRSINHTWIENIEIPDTVILIDIEAIRFNDNLKTIVLPEKRDGQIIVSKGCFSYNQSLEKVYNIELLKDISKADNLFVLCRKLKYLDLSGLELATLPAQCFKDCESLEEIKINENLSWTICTGCFAHSGIKEFPFKSVIALGTAAFKDTKIISVELNCPLQAPNLFEDCKELENVVINHDNIKVSTSSFANCYNLKKIVFNNHDTKSEFTIYEGAFVNCRKLTEIAYNTKPNITKILQDAFYGCTKLSYFPLEKIVFIGEAAFKECKNLSEIQIKAEKTTSTPVVISNKAFWGCKKINSLKVDDTVDNAIIIGDNAFNHCENLETIEIKNIGSIEGNSFSNCPNIKRIILENIPYRDVISKMKKNPIFSPFVEKMFNDLFL